MEYVRFNRNGGTTRHQTHASVVRRVHEGSLPQIRDKRVRYGKTARDRANNAHSRNAARKAARVAWYNDTKWNSEGNFPV